MKRRSLAWYREHPRAFEERVAEHDREREFEHNSGEWEAGEDRFERQQARWLTRVDEDTAA